MLEHDARGEQCDEHYDGEGQVGLHESCGVYEAAAEEHPHCYRHHVVVVVLVYKQAGREIVRGWIRSPLVVRDG